MNYYALAAVAYLLGALTGRPLVDALKTLSARKVLTYLPHVFSIVDPIMKYGLPKLNKEDVIRVFLVASDAVADGDLTAEEVRTLAKVAFKKFDPKIAADVQVDPSKLKQINDMVLHAKNNELVQDIDMIKDLTDWQGPLSNVKKKADLFSSFLKF